VPAGGAESVGGADAQRPHSAESELATHSHEPDGNVFVAGARPGTDGQRKSRKHSKDTRSENVRTARRMTAAELSLDAPVDRRRTVVLGWSVLSYTNVLLGVTALLRPRCRFFKVRRWEQIVLEASRTPAIVCRVFHDRTYERATQTLVRKS